MSISTEGALKGPLKYTYVVILAKLDYLLYFNIQRTEKYGTAMFYLDHSCCSYDDDCWKTGCGGWVISAITASLANHQNKVDQDFLFCLQENHTTGKYIFNNLLNGLREGVPKKSFCSFGFCSNERGEG